MSKDNTVFKLLMGVEKMQIRKALCILLTVTMIIGILPCVTYAADNKSRIIYFNDFESEDITGNASIAAQVEQN